MSIHCTQQKSMVDSDMLESESCTVSVGGGSPGDGGGGTTTEREREETLGEGGCWRGKLSESTLSRESRGERSVWRFIRRRRGRVLKFCENQLCAN